MNWVCSVAILALSTLVAPAHADPIFNDDFQDGTADGWKAMGTGDVRLTKYGDNASMRLEGDAASFTVFSTQGFTDIAIGVSFAAMSLGSNGACAAEASADGGNTWTQVHRIVAGQDDGVTMHPGGGAIAGIDNLPRVLLRLLVKGGTGATCWADNVRVSGRPIHAKLAPAFDAAGHRATLMHDELLDSSAPPRGVAMSAFAPHAAAPAPPRNHFRGRLVFTAERAGGVLHVLRDDFSDATSGNGAAHRLPKFDFAFVQSGNALIPVRRGAIPDANPENEFILEPGIVWDEPGDSGYSRAAIPFSLEERNANCMHNGVMTFLFKDGGAISDVAFEIGSETCFYFKFDMWGRMAATYTPGPVDGEDAAVAAYRREIAGRMPMKDIAALATDYPGVHPENFGSPAEVDLGFMTLYGVVAGGVNYVSGCNTRFGPYPFCDVLDLPSYSVSKSIFAGTALMRLSLLYPGIARETIAGWVPECAHASTWGDVTFENALDMATGHYILAGDQADENSGADIGPFFVAEGHAGKITFACTHYPRKVPPGALWVYHTADTYVLGTAMDAYVHQKLGPAADVYRDIVAEPIWRKLNLSPPVFVTRRTYDSAAQPFAGYGLTLHRDDIAKIATFINVDRGAIGGQPMLDQHMLDAALQRDPDDRGLRGPSDVFRYNNGYWAWNAQAWLGCKSPTWIPFMSGYGGIAVALFPNGITYYYFSDGGVWAWAMAAAEADRMKPFCER